MSPLETIQAMNLGRILNAAALATVNVLEERKGITDADIAQSLASSTMRAGKKGAAIVVQMPTFHVVDPNAPGPCLLVEQGIRCIEKPGFNYGANGTGLSVEVLSIAVTQLMHQFGIQMNAQGPTPAGSMFITFSAVRGDTEIYTGGEREILIIIRGKLDLPMLLKTPAPVISGSSESGVIILSAEGSVVYYTTDGTYPAPGAGSTAQLYGETELVAQDGVLLESQTGAPLEAQTGNSLSVASGTLVLAVATLPNQQASNLAGLTVS